MTNHGWRKPTPGLAQADQLAQAGEQRSAPKSKCIVALKRVGVHIGLKPSELTLLDTLAAFTRPLDWEEGRRPIAWPSNGYLMEQTGFSLSALKRYGRHLAELGLITFNDSPNGKRWGRRDAEGRIVEAYGFDLSPLSVRVTEFEMLDKQIREDREERWRLKQQITVARRMVRARIEAAVQEALSGPWTRLEAAFESLLAKLPRQRKIAAEQLQALLKTFHALLLEVEQAFRSAVGVSGQCAGEVRISPGNVGNTQIMASKGSKSGPHILTTKESEKVKSNCFGKEKRNKIHSEIEPDVQKQNAAAVDTDIEWSTNKNRSRSEITIPVIMQACPQFAEMSRDMSLGYIEDWNSLHRAAGQLCGMAGISGDAWQVAQKALGPEVAATAVALVFDKFSTGEVKSAGGYLRGMVQNAKAGELHLNRSIYGRLSERGV